MPIAIVPRDQPAELDLDGLGVGELVRWLEPGEWRPKLAGLTAAGRAKRGGVTSSTRCRPEGSS